MVDKYFLVIRDNLNGHTEIQPFEEDSDAAFASYFAAERKYKVEKSEPESADIEVVLITAESEASLRQGYPHYFDTGTRAQRQQDFAKRTRALALGN